MPTVIHEAEPERRGLRASPEERNASTAARGGIADPVRGKTEPMLGHDALEAAMYRALELATRGPTGDPNPQVGCVILDSEGRTVAEGWHMGSGTPHAETAALAQLPEAWRARADELTAVVTLEPCNHSGRTGPCARTLGEFGIGSVVYALDDPGPDASGGAETLRAAGVEVLGGVLTDEARALLGPWLRAHRRPRVIVKWAQTLDGRAAAADGSSRWITGPEARADVHRRRAAADAILIGTGTLISDDPSLTARDERGAPLVPPAEQPLPVIVGRRDVPGGARVRSHPALAAHGLDAPIRLAGDDLARDLAELRARGVRSVFVEGGPSVAGSLIAAELVDELIVYIAPALLGGPGLALEDLGVSDMEEIKRLDVASIERLGDDLLLQARILQPDGPAQEDGGEGENS